MFETKYALIALALSMGTPSIATAETPKQLEAQQRRIERQVETVALASCKLDWIKTGNKSRTAVYAFMAECIARQTSAQATVK